MTTAIVRFNPTINKYEMVIDGEVLGRSGDRNYFEYHAPRNEIGILRRKGIVVTEWIHDDTGSLTTLAMAINNPSQDQNQVMQPASVFTIVERFEMMDELIEMTIQGSSKSMLIAGKGGIGKSHAVLQVLKRLGKTDVNKVIAEMTPEAISLDDTEDEIEEKVETLSTMENLGDYKIVKGYSSPKALYRLLYENRHRTIIFDDCDSVLKDANAINLLKTALDTYEERWVSWNIEMPFGSDLPQCFRFEGQVIFITNLEIDKVDEAVRTRAFKVDVSMTKTQRIEYMEYQLHNVMPDVDFQMRCEALDLLKNNMHLSNDINFRALQKLITIRTDAAVKDWEKTARFVLTQH